MAQLGRASALGAEGRTFKSCRPEVLKIDKCRKKKIMKKIKSSILLLSLFLVVTFIFIREADAKRISCPELASEYLVREFHVKEIQSKLSPSQRKLVVIVEPNGENKFTVIFPGETIELTQDCSSVSYELQSSISGTDGQGNPAKFDFKYNCTGVVKRNKEIVSNCTSDFLKELLSPGEPLREDFTQKWRPTSEKRK